MDSSQKSFMKVSADNMHCVTETVDVSCHLCWIWTESDVKYNLNTAFVLLALPLSATIGGKTVSFSVCNEDKISPGRKAAVVKH